MDHRQPAGEFRRRPQLPTAGTHARTADILVRRPCAGRGQPRHPPQCPCQLLAARIAEEYGLDGGEVAAACVAGAVHDCRRHDDRADPGHGLRAASWFLRHTDTVIGALGHDVPVTAMHRAAAAVAVHDVPYDRFTVRQERAYRKAPHLVDVLKAADCLDRYRLPLKHWWPDTSRLRIPVPGWLPPVAFALVVHSEQARLDGANSAQALAAARQILAPGR